MEKFKRELEFDGLFIVPSDGRGGGLALLWKLEMAVWVDSFSKFHIDAIVNSGSKEAWRLTGFYGEPDRDRREEGWNMLRMLRSRSELPWCCFGDFNELLKVGDKRGGAPWSHNQMQQFKDVLDHYGFVNLGFSGPAFTWRGRRRGEWIWERLDRGVVNYDWLEKFPTGRIRNLPCITSDHYPILLTLDAEGEKQRWKRKSFRFEAMWLTDSGCHHTVSKAWESNPTSALMF